VLGDQPRRSNPFPLERQPGRTLKWVEIDCGPTRAVIRRPFRGPQ
jgi:hypothetical protein